MTAQSKKNERRRGKKTPTPLEDKIVQLARQGNTQAEIEQVTGVPQRTISDIVHRHFTADEIADFRLIEADTLAEKRCLILNTVTDGEIKKMSPRDRIMSYGILYDKEQLERGNKSTTRPLVIVNKISLSSTDRQPQEITEAQVIDIPNNG